MEGHLMIARQAHTQDLLKRAYLDTPKEGH
jgi:hypothetical protein